jgi:hypothetical protein
MICGKLGGMQMKEIVKMAVFWDVAPCSPVDTDQNFRDAYCIHHLSKIIHCPGDRGSKCL